jgi:hypothetical protein
MPFSTCPRLYISLRIFTACRHHKIFHTVPLTNSEPVNALVPGAADVERSVMELVL